MTEYHPITPPPELVKELWDKFRKTPINSNAEEIAWKQAIAQAVQWATDQANADIERKLQEAADQELEACIELIKDHGWFANPEHRVNEVRAVRRPKPPSLKEEALATLQRISKNSFPCSYQDDGDWDTIRRAIESIPDHSS